MKYSENLNWSLEEHNVLQRWLDFAKVLNISEEAIFEEIKKLKLDITNLNNWLETTARKINEAIFRAALLTFNEGNFYPDKQINRKFREYFQVVLQDNVYDWFPSINRTEIHFNNILDDIIDVNETSDITKEKMVKEVLNYLFNKFEIQYNLK